MSDPAQAKFNALFGPEFGHGKPFDLTPLHAALSALGDPQTKLPPVIHVAGTNGKGSTIAFLRAIAEAAGLSVHAFTKPHLLNLRERFRVAGKLASDEALIAAATRVAHAAPELTQFDAQIAVAFLLFSETPADLTLLETGLGGRDDSTNVIPNPAITVLTPIALDHQDVLGASLAEIATHKAGILKRGAPTIIARQAPEVLETIEAQAARVGAPVYSAGAEWDAFAQAGRLIVQTETRALDLPLPALIGAHQIDNAGLACAVFLTSRLFAFDDDVFARGIAHARWPGRLQAISSGPLKALAGDAELWVDGGHNPHAAEALTRALADLNRKRPARTALIIGMRARKDWRAFVETMAPSAAFIVAVPLGEEGASPNDIAQAARDCRAEALAAPDLQNAIGAALANGAGRILICGSLALAGVTLRASNLSVD